MPTGFSIRIFPALMKFISRHIQYLPRSQVRICLRTPGTPIIIENASQWTYIWSLGSYSESVLPQATRSLDAHQLLRALGYLRLCHSQILVQGHP